MKFRNPVIPGFHPDPSCCCVGRDYYLVTSTFEYFPGVPVFHSRDLVHWRQIGYCLTRRSQLPLEGCRCSGGIFAPTIRHHDGVFYMTTTNVTGGGNFYVTTTDPAREWSEPVWVDFPGIDPSFLFDDDGKVYLAGPSEGVGIWQAEIDIGTGKLLGERRLVWPGTGGLYPEGPHLYKINDTYYMMNAEGGTEYGHMETIARGKSPWGPFEPCPHNPMLTHRNRIHEIQATGHAELIQAHDGSWWMVFLGIRTRGGRFHHLGRETFLAPVAWTDDGWPVVNGDGTVEIEMEAECLPPHPWESEPVRDDFDSPKLRPCWNFLRNPSDGDWSLNERPGWLRLNGSAVTLSDLASPAFLGRRQQHFRCRAACLIEFEPRTGNEEAGLTALANATHHYDIAVTVLDGKRTVIVRRRIGDLEAVVARAPLGEGPVTLRIDAADLEYTFSCAESGRSMQRLATGASRHLATEVCGGFTGVYLGMYATGAGRPASVPADFDWFDYRPS